MTIHTKLFALLLLLLLPAALYSNPRPQSASDVSVAGSLRRWEETIGVIDIVASAKDSEAVVRKFQEF